MSDRPSAGQCLDPMLAGAKRLGIGIDTWILMVHGSARASEGLTS